MQKKKIKDIDFIKQKLIKKITDFEKETLPNIKVSDDFIETFINENKKAFDSILDLQETFDIKFHSSLNISSENILKLFFENRKKVAKLQDTDFFWYNNLIKELRDKINNKINQLYIEQGLKLKDSFLALTVLKERNFNAQSFFSSDDDDDDDNSGGNYQ